MTFWTGGLNVCTNLHGNPIAAEIYCNIYNYITVAFDKCWTKRYFHPSYHPDRMVHNANNYSNNITFPSFHHIQFLISEGKIWQHGKDTRTLWRQQPWSCFSLPPAPSLQSLCVSGGGKQRVSWCLCKHLHQHRFRKNPCCHSWSHPGRRMHEADQGTGREAGSYSGKHLTSIHKVQWLMSTVYLSSGSYTRFSSSETKAADSCIRKYSDSGTHCSLPCSLSVSSPHAPWFSPHFLACSHPLLLICWLHTAECNDKSNSIVMWYIECGPRFVQWV